MPDGPRIPAWAHGPAELFRHAEDHFQQSSDTDRRLALIGFDNAIEVCVDAFVSLHPRNRGGYEIRRAEREQILENFYTKIDFIERYATERQSSLDGISLSEVLWYHQLRNELYHSGNGMTPERHHIVDIRDAARAVFRLLYDVDVLPPAPDVRASAETPASPSFESGVAPDLRLLGAYIELEKALGAWAGFKQGRAQASVFWARFRDEHPWTSSVDPVVRRAREVRNAMAHGRLVGYDPDELERLTSMLTDVAQRIRAERPSRSAESKGLRGRALAHRLHDIAREFDAEREGVSVSDLLELLTAEGDHVSGHDPARTAYDALKNAQDLFHLAAGAFVWEASPGEVAGLSGRLLREAIVDQCGWMNAAPLGRHYYAVLSHLEGQGLSVKGPNRAATVNQVLVAGTNQGLFERTAPGTYRCGSGADRLGRR